MKSLYSCDLSFGLENLELPLLTNVIMHMFVHHGFSLCLLTMLLAEYMGFMFIQDERFWIACCDMIS